MNSFFLKIHIDLFFLKFPDNFDTFYCISGKSGYGFRTDDVNLSCFTVFQHTHKIRSAFFLGSAFAIVCIDACEIPAGFAANHVFIILQLRFIRAFLVWNIGTDSAISTNVFRLLFHFHICNIYPFYFFFHSIPPFFQAKDTCFSVTHLLFFS